MAWPETIWDFITKSKVSLFSSLISPQYIGDLDQSILELKRGLFIAPDNGMLHQSLSASYARKGDYENAITVFCCISHISSFSNHYFVMNLLSNFFN